MHRGEGRPYPGYLPKLYCARWSIYIHTCIIGSYQTCVSFHRLLAASYHISSNFKWEDSPAGWRILRSRRRMKWEPRRMPRYRIEDGRRCDWRELIGEQMLLTAPRTCRSPQSVSYHLHAISVSSNNLNIWKEVSKVVIWGTEFHRSISVRHGVQLCYNAIRKSRICISYKRLRR